MESMQEGIALNTSPRGIRQDIATGLFKFESFRANQVHPNNNFKRQKREEIKCVIYKTPFIEWTNACRSNWDRKGKDCKVYDRGHYYNTYGDAVDDDEVLAGLDPYEKLQFFEEFLENKYKIEREMFQREVHSICLAICAHLIVGQEWRFVGKAIVKHRKWEKLVKSLSLVAMGYRRAGKTSSIQMHASTSAITIPGVSISVFALAKRISIALGKGTAKMIAEAGYAHMLYARSDEIITLRVNENPLTERTIFMSPGNPDVSIFFVGDISDSILTLLSYYTIFYSERMPWVRRSGDQRVGDGCCDLHISPKSFRLGHKRKISRLNSNTLIQLGGYLASGLITQTFCNNVYSQNTREIRTNNNDIGKSDYAVCFSFRFPNV